MKTTFETLTIHKRQQGAALIVGLLLLLVITVLAVSGMNTATTELAMARNDQSYENAFQAAESGLENALAQNTFVAAAVPVIIAVPPIANSTVAADITYEKSTIADGYSFGVASAYHFLATSQAEYQFSAGNERNASATHTQAFFVVGAPDAGNFN